MEALLCQVLCMGAYYSLAERSALRVTHRFERTVNRQPGNRAGNSSSRSKNCKIISKDMQRMLEIMGLGSQVLVALDLEQTYWRTFLNSAVLFDGVRELLDEIRLYGIPTAIVTDLTAQIQFRKIIYFGPFEKLSGKLILGTVFSISFSISIKLLTCLLFINVMASPVLSALAVLPILCT